MDYEKKYPNLSKLKEIMGKTHYQNWTIMQSGNRWTWLSDDELEPLAEKVINTITNKIKENKDGK